MARGGREARDAHPEDNAGGSCRAQQVRHGGGWEGELRVVTRVVLPCSEKNRKLFSDMKVGGLCGQLRGARCHARRAQVLSPEELDARTTTWQEEYVNKVCTEAAGACRGCGGHDGEQVEIESRAMESLVYGFTLPAGYSAQVRCWRTGQRCTCTRLHTGRRRASPGPSPRRAPRASSQRLRCGCGWQGVTCSTRVPAARR